MPRSQPEVEYASRRRWTEKEARAALVAQGASGLSLRAFARREGLDVQRLVRWRHRLEVSSAPVHFVEVATQRRPEPIEILLASGRVLRVSESVDVAVVARLAEALDGERSC
jgi:hypothetical protein